MRFPRASRLHLALLAGLLFAPRVVAAQTIAVNASAVTSTTVAPSTKITVPVIVDLTNVGGANIASLSTGVTWASARLTFDSIRVATGLGWTLTSNLAGAGAGSISFTVSNATALGATATVVNVFFTSSASSGQTKVTLAPTAALNASLQSILQLIQPRALDVLVATTNGKWGDVNNDVNVDIIDAQQIARSAVLLSVLNPAALALRGDVNADGSVNIIDAQQIARFSVALSYAPRINTDLTPAPVVASATLAPSAAQNLGVGGTVQEVITARDAGNADITGCCAFTWSSSNSAVATVNADGFVTGISPGTVTITATSVTSPGVTASVTVNVSGTPIIRVSFAHGGRVARQYVAQVNGTGITSFLGYSVSGASMTGATMDVAVPGPGTYTVRIVALDAATGTPLFLVGGQLAVVVPAGGGLVSRSLTLTSSTFTMTTLPSVVIPNALIPVAWTIVDPSGVIDLGPQIFCGAAQSSTSVLATDFSGTTTQYCSVTTPVPGTITFAFFNQPPLVSMTAPASPGSVKLNVRGGHYLRFTQTDSIFVWWINPSITRSEAPLAVSVVQVNSVTVTPAAQLLGVGGTLQMTATARDVSSAVINGLTTTWVSTLPSVATISSSGLVTGVANGTTDIQATIGGVTNSTTVQISGGINVGSITVAPLGPLSGNATTTAVATVRDPSNNIIGAAVQWSSSNPLVARVAADGTVQALGNGTTDIKATIGAINGFAALTVNQIAQNFTIEVRALTAMSPAATAAFATAAARWAQVIRGDEPDVVLSNFNVSGCVSGVANLNETIDDLVIYATVAPIDGVGNVLGSAGPCASRNGSLHAYIGRMTFDAADVANMEANGTLLPVIMHEMGHVLGIGTTWSSLGLLANPAPANPDPAGDPTFIGANAQWAFQNLGLAYGGAIVPVENCCGPGTRNAHWRETILLRELMTGFVSPGGQPDPLSPLTSASLADLGYVVDVSFSDAQPWVLLSPIPAVRVRIEELPMPPPVVTDLNGRILVGGGTIRMPAVPIRPPPKNPSP